MKRPSCTQLCPPVERYINQDNVPGGREVLLPDITYGNESPWADSPDKTPYISERDLAIATLQAAGFSRKSIREILKLSPVKLRVRLFHLRERLKRI